MVDLFIVCFCCLQIPAQRHAVRGSPAQVIGARSLIRLANHKAQLQLRSRAYDTAQLHSPIFYGGMCKKAVCNMELTTVGMYNLSVETTYYSYLGAL